MKRKIKKRVPKQADILAKEFNFAKEEDAEAKAKLIKAKADIKNEIIGENSFTKQAGATQWLYGEEYDVGVTTSTPSKRLDLTIAEAELDPDLFKQIRRKVVTIEAKENVFVRLVEEGEISAKQAKKIMVNVSSPSQTVKVRSHKLDD